MRVLKFVDVMQNNNTLDVVQCYQKCKDLNINVVQNLYYTLEFFIPDIK